MRIEVFNPCDENDDQKTSTAILFDDNQSFLGTSKLILAFGNPALQRYAEMLEDQESGLLFQTVRHRLYLVQNASAPHAPERKKCRRTRNATYDCHIGITSFHLWQGTY